MQVFYLKSTVQEDIHGRQTRNEKRTDWTFGSKFCARMGRPLPTVEDLATDYDKVFMTMDPTDIGWGAMDDIDLDEVFRDFQADFMPESVCRQVRNVIRRSHNSMSVGDIVVDHGTLWFCDNDGWTIIGKVN